MIFWSGRLAKTSLDHYVHGFPEPNHDTISPMKIKSRRKSLKVLMLSTWVPPVIQSATLPAHASISEDEEPVITTLPPTTLPPDFNIQTAITITPSTGISGSVPMRVFIQLRNVTANPVPMGTSIIISTDFGSPMEFVYNPVATDLPGGITVNNSNWNQIGPERWAFSGGEIPAFGTTSLGWIGEYNSTGTGTQTITVTSGITDALDNDDSDSEVIVFSN